MEESYDPKKVEEMVEEVNPETFYDNPTWNGDLNGRRMQNCPVCGVYPGQFHAEGCKNAK